MSQLAGSRGVSKAEAVAATEAKAAFGYDIVFHNPPLVLTVAPQDVLSTTTPVLEAGTWLLSAVVAVEGSAAGTDLFVQYIVNGQPFNPILSESGVAGGGFVLSSTIPFVWTAGTQTFLFTAAHISGPGVGTALFSSFSWRRVK